MRYEAGIAVEISARVWMDGGSEESSGSMDDPNARFSEHLFLNQVSPSNIIHIFANLIHAKLEGHVGVLGRAVVDEHSLYTGYAMRTPSPRTKRNGPIHLCIDMYHGQPINDGFRQSRNQDEEERGEYWEKKIGRLITVPFAIWRVSVNYHHGTD